MITQYTANALAQKIASLALPSQMFNITSANESEDVVSYGATACQRLLEQLDLINLFNSIYLTVNAQGYALARREMAGLNDSLYSEQIFGFIQEHFGNVFPIMGETSFESLYKKAGELLKRDLSKHKNEYTI